MKFTIAILILSAVMAFLSGCSELPKKCANPEHVDSRGGCSARWM